VHEHPRCSPLRSLAFTDGWTNGHPPGALAGLRPFKRVLQLPARVFVTEDLGPALQHHLPQDVRHRVQVFQGVPRRRIVQPGQAAPRPAAVLRRTAAVTGDAAREGLARSASSRLSSILTSCRQGMFRSYSYMNRAPRRRFNSARVTSGDDADTPHDP